jgi:hypothetical protein
VTAAAANHDWAAITTGADASYLPLPSRVECVTATDAGASVMARAVDIAGDGISSIAVRVHLDYAHRWLTLPGYQRLGAAIARRPNIRRVSAASHVFVCQCGAGRTAPLRAATLAVTNRVRRVGGEFMDDGDLPCMSDPAGWDAPAAPVPVGQIAVPAPRPELIPTCITFDTVDLYDDSPFLALPSEFSASDALVAFASLNGAVARAVRSRASDGHTARTLVDEAVRLRAYARAGGGGSAVVIRPHALDYVRLRDAPGPPHLTSIHAYCTPALGELLLECVPVVRGLREFVYVQRNIAEPNVETFWALLAPRVATVEVLRVETPGRGPTIAETPQEWTTPLAAFAQAAPRLRSVRITGWACGLRSATAAAAALQALLAHPTLAELQLSLPSENLATAASAARAEGSGPTLQDVQYCFSAARALRRVSFSFDGPLPLWAAQGVAAASALRACALHAADAGPSDGAAVMPLMQMPFLRALEVTGCTFNSPDPFYCHPADLSQCRYRLRELELVCTLTFPLDAAFFVGIARCRPHLAVLKLGKGARTALAEAPNGLSVAALDALYDSAPRLRTVDVRTTRVPHAIAMQTAFSRSGVFQVSAVDGFLAELS